MNFPTLPAVRLPDRAPRGSEGPGIHTDVLKNFETLRLQVVVSSSGVDGSEQHGIGASKKNHATGTGIVTSCPEHSMKLPYHMPIGSRYLLRMVLDVKVLPENGRTGGQRTSDLDGPGPLGMPYTLTPPTTPGLIRMAVPWSVWVLLPLESHVARSAVGSHPPFSVTSSIAPNSYLHGSLARHPALSDCWSCHFG